MAYFHQSSRGPWTFLATSELSKRACRKCCKVSKNCVPRLKRRCQLWEGVGFNLGMWFFFRIHIKHHKTQSEPPDGIEQGFLWWKDCFMNPSLFSLWMSWGDNEIHGFPARMMHSWGIRSICFQENCNGIGRFHNSVQQKTCLEK